MQAFSEAEKVAALKTKVSFGSELTAAQPLFEAMTRNSRSGPTFFRS